MKFSTLLSADCRSTEPQTPLHTMPVRSQVWRGWDVSWPLPRPRLGLSAEKGRRVRVRRVFAGEIMALSWLGNTLVCSPKKRWRAWLEEKKVWASLLRWLPLRPVRSRGQFTANEQWAGWDNPRREKQSNLNFQHNLKFNFPRCSIMSFSRKWSLKCSWMGPNFG